MNPHRESAVVEADRIIWQEWICESKVKQFFWIGTEVSDAVSSRYRGQISKKFCIERVYT